MAAEAAKFDDMMLALKLKVLAPVMNFLSSGYLDRFFGILPQIAQTIGSIFKAMVPIIEEVTRVILDAMPYVTKLVDDWLIPFIKMFPQIVKSFLGLIGINEASTEANMAKILEYLGIVAAVLVGWKAFTFLGDAVGKLAEWVNPRSKKIMNATVGDLGDEIRRSTQPTPGGGLFGGGLTAMISSILLAMAGMGIGSLIFKYFFGEQSQKEFKNLANFSSNEGIEKVKTESKTNMLKKRGETAFMTAGGLGLTGGKLLYDSSKVGIRGAQEALALETARTAALEQTLTFGEQRAIAGGAFKSTVGKESSKNVANKVVAPVGVALAGLDWYNVLTSDKKGMSKYLEVAAAGLNTYAAYSLISGAAMTATGVGALPGAGTAATGVVAGITGGILNLTSDIIDANDKREKKRAEFEKLYSEETRKLAEQSTISRKREFEESGSMFGGKREIALQPTSVLSADTYKEFQKMQEQDKAKFYNENTIRRIVEQKDLQNFVNQTFGKDEETYLKERLGLVMLSNDIDAIEAQRNLLKQKYVKDGFSVAQAETKLDQLVGENLEQTKSRINERMFFTGQEINKISNTFEGLIKAFKLGDFSKLSKALGEIFFKMKLFLVQLVADVTNSGTGFKIAKSLFGEDFGKDATFKKSALGIVDYVDTTEFNNYIKRLQFDSDVRLKGTLDSINESYKIKEERDKKESEKQDKARKLQEQQLKESQKLTGIAQQQLNKDTKVEIKDNINNFDFSKGTQVWGL